MIRRDDHRTDHADHADHGAPSDQTAHADLAARSGRAAGPVQGGAKGSLLAIGVGNTRLSCGLFSGTTLETRVSMDAATPDQAELTGLIGRAGAICIASVHPGHLAGVRGLIRAAGRDSDVELIGLDVDIPIRHTLEDASTLGQDRALNALAAHSLVGEACVVVDAGTAVTIDFVDGTGVYHGGMILPGVRAMLASLHASTAALPELAFDRPDDARGPFGKDTAHAMMLGVQTAVQGAVRLAVERFAVSYEAYPRVIATGGDAVLIEDDDSIVERIIPELQLVGIQRAWQRSFEPEANTDRHDFGDSGGSGDMGGSGVTAGLE